jgi:uncharacterized protein with PIN domain
VKFIADEMLGKLARWLRMIGVDVIYQNQIEDEKLIQMARNENRIILSRDTHLIKHLDPKEYLFIHYDYLEEQFSECLRQFPDIKSEEKPLSRCVVCNTPLKEIDKESVKGRVWPFVYQTQDNFTECEKCQKIYWRATHVNKILDRIDRLLTRPPS